MTLKPWSATLFANQAALSLLVASERLVPFHFWFLHCWWVSTVDFTFTHLSLYELLSCHFTKIHKDSQRFIPILIKGTSRGGWVVQGRELWHLFRGCANSRWLHTMLGWEYSVAKGAGWCANIIVIIISIIHLLFLLSWIMYDYAVCVYIYIYSDSLHIS
jgi:hypothetical protein